MLQHQTCTRIATFWGFFIILIVCGLCNETHYIVVR